MIEMVRKKETKFSLHLAPAHYCSVLGAPSLDTPNLKDALFRYLSGHAGGKIGMDLAAPLLERTQSQPWPWKKRKSSKQEKEEPI